MKRNVNIDDNEKQAIKKELDSLYFSSAKGAQVRSRAYYVEEGEKSTKYFLGLEKKRQKCNTINVLKCKDKTLTTDEGILKAAADFYDELYRSCKPNHNDITDYLQNIPNLKKLSDLERDSIEGRVTFTEASKAIKSLKRNKSPG